VGNVLFSKPPARWKTGGLVFFFRAQRAFLPEAPEEMGGI